MIKFTVQGETYGWDSVNQRLITGGGKLQDVYWETGIGGMCDVRKVVVGGKPCPVPEAFTVKDSSIDLHNRLVNFDKSALKVLSLETLRGWQKTVRKGNWCCDDIAFLIACMSAIALKSRRKDHRYAFGELVGLYLLTVAQTALLLQLLQDEFYMAPMNGQQQRGGREPPPWRDPENLYDEHDEDARNSSRVDDLLI